MNIFWIGVAENDATVRGVHFRNVLAIETLFYFRNFAKTLSIINRKQEFATLLGILSRLVHVSFHTPRCNEREIVLSKTLVVRDRLRRAFCVRAKCDAARFRTS